MDKLAEESCQRFYNAIYMLVPSLNHLCSFRHAFTPTHLLLLASVRPLWVSHSVFVGLIDHVIHIRFHSLKTFAQSSSHSRPQPDIPYMFPRSRNWYIYLIFWKSLIRRFCLSVHREEDLPAAAGVVCQAASDTRQADGEPN